MTDNKQELIASLLAEYNLADEEVNRIKNLLNEANKNRSNVVKKILNQVGKGPFSYKGKYLGKVVVRTNKTTNEDTYFFRGKDDTETIKVE